MSPLVTVVMPIREFSPFVTESVNSILAQTLENLELLIIGYPEIRHWQHRLPNDPRITILQREGGPGIVSALNTGLDNAKGHFIARMDADDISLPDRFQSQIDYLRDNPDVSIAGAKVEIFLTDGDIQSGNERYQQWLNSLTEPDAIEHHLFVESPLPHPTLFAPTDVFRQLDGYRDSEWAEDYDMLLRAYLAGLRMGKPDNVLLRWRDHDDRLTRKDERYSKTQFIEAKAWALSASIARHRAVVICGTGSNATKMHDAFQRYNIPVECFVELESARKRTAKKSLPVISYQQLLESKTSALIVSAVSAHGAREKLDLLFQAHGLTQNQDYVLVG